MKNKFSLVFNFFFKKNLLYFYNEAKADRVKNQYKLLVF
jgi:hypothetical protein